MASAFRVAALRLLAPDRLTSPSALTKLQTRSGTRFSTAGLQVLEKIEPARKSGGKRRSGRRGGILPHRSATAAQSVGGAKVAAIAARARDALQRAIECL
jgi:hypothetical protein